MKWLNAIMENGMIMLPWVGLGTFVLAVALTCAGCSLLGVPIAPGTVKEAVWTPCPVALPARPVFPADALDGSEDLWTLGKTLWADRLSRRAYEADLEIKLAGCTAPERPQ